MSDLFDVSSDEEENSLRSLKRTRKPSKTNPRKKAKKVPETTTTSTVVNHDDLFKQLSLSSSSNNKSPEQIDVDQIDLTKEKSIHHDLNEIADGEVNSMLLRKLETISNQLNRYTLDMDELKGEVSVLKRLVVRVEVMMKCRKENNPSSDLDAYSPNTLQSYGFPIDTKAKFDALEQRLKNDDEKSKLVRAMNLIA